ncbi:MAG: UbiA prenyltransferase family protein [Candidatus Lokiarchaeota archaeon]|nr:UbiA prenyltransferase family protein [Candidatus Lokiarchaeota archaeon]
MVHKIKSIFHLLRVRQYYKNVMIFVGIFFSQRLFELSLYFTMIIGFILLCCASSFNYIINDLRDIEEDKTHPEKLRKKPLASGELSLPFAIILLMILALVIISCLIFIIPNIMFIFMLIMIIITGQFYNYLLKNYAFIDILILSTGYLWRALAGCAIIIEYVSAWLFLAIFEIALFLSIAKRKGDLMLLGKDKAIKHKKVYDQYSSKLLDQFQVMTASSLFITYSLYLIFKFELYIPGSASLIEYMVIFTIPISLYIIMRFMYLTSAKPEIARSTEKVFFDKGFIIAALLLSIFLFLSFYFNEIVEILNL